MVGLYRYYREIFFVTGFFNVNGIELRQCDPVMKNGKSKRQNSV